MRHFPCSRKVFARQRGVVLLIALIALVAMTLTAVSLVRSMDTGNTILGNLAFKNDTINASDVAIEQARLVLASLGSAGVNNDDASKGYYSTNKLTTDFTGTKTPGDTSDDVDWGDGLCSSCATKASTKAADGSDLTVNGMPASFVIARICTVPGLTPTDPANSCLTTTGTSSGSTSQTGGASGGGYQVRVPPNTGIPYYRIVVRVAGPRNTYSYVEAVVI